MTLAEIETLMRAEPGTPEGNRLDVLATLVEAWEARHMQIEAPGSDRGHPVHDGAKGSAATGLGARHRQSRQGG